MNRDNPADALSSPEAKSMDLELRIEYHMDHSATITLTAADYASANRLHVKKEFTRPIAVIIWALFAIIYLSFLYIPTVRSYLSDVPTDLVHFFLLLMIAFPFINYLVIAPLTAHWTFPRQKTLHYPITYSWSEAGLAAKSDRGEWLVLWADYRKRAENAKVAMFYQSPRLFQLLPKRALTPEQQVSLRRCAVEGMSRSP